MCDGCFKVRDGVKMDSIDDLDDDPGLKRVGEIGSVPLAIILSREPEGREVKDTRRASAAAEAN